MLVERDDFQQGSMAPTGVVLCEARFEDENEDVGRGNFVSERTSEVVDE
jgi:hypothetical protein